MRLKRWESPRRQGRNDKGKGGSARQRQLKKQQQMLRKKLKDNTKEKIKFKQEGERKEFSLFPFWDGCFLGKNREVKIFLFTDALFSRGEAYADKADNKLYNDIFEN